MDNRNRIKMRIIIVLSIIISFFNCIGGVKDQHPDPYYHETGGWDYRRMPLTKPLELISNDKITWGVIGYKANIYSITSINKMKCVDSLHYLFRSLGTVYIKGVEYNQAWFIADIKDKSIDGYTDYQVFTDSLNMKYNIQIDTAIWKSPDDYYKEFVKIRKLPWIPDWKENR